MVLFYHALFPMWETDVLSHIPWLYFFIPWFFYKSGMFFVQKEERLYRWSKFIYPFVVWSFIGWLAYIGWHWHIGDLTPRLAFYSPLRSLLLSAYIPLNSALWFLPILYLVRLLGNRLLPNVRIEWMVLVTLVASVLFECLHIPLMPSWIIKTVWGLFFFTCGYWLKNYERKRWLIAIAAVVYAVSLITPIPAVYGGKEAPLWCHLVWYPSCALSCVLFNDACQRLSELTDKLGAWQFPVLRYMGRYAMSFYVPHYLIFALVYNIIGTYFNGWYSGWQGLVIVTIAYATLLPSINCLDRYVNRMKKRK